MKERGMIFNDEMVRAILDGRKTQTRRIANSSTANLLHLREQYPHKHYNIDCPFGQTGDRIWVRETFSCIGNDDGHPVDANGNLCSREEAQRIYRATAIQKPGNYGLWTSPDGFDFEGAWTPSIHMPRWASRILLEITGVRAERLNSISEKDALREGLYQLPASGRYCLQPGMQYFGGASHCAKEVYSWLWESIYGEHSWQANPWVWVIEFKRIEEEAL